MEFGELLVQWNFRFLPPRRLTWPLDFRFLPFDWPLDPPFSALISPKLVISSPNVPANNKWIGKSTISITCNSSDFLQNRITLHTYRVLWVSFDDVFPLWWQVIGWDKLLRTPPSPFGLWWSFVVHALLQWSRSVCPNILLSSLGWCLNWNNKKRIVWNQCCE